MYLSHMEGQSMELSRQWGAHFSSRSLLQEAREQAEHLLHFLTALSNSYYLIIVPYETDSQNLSAKWRKPLRVALAKLLVL